MSEISVAVVSWNTRELLQRCLRSFEPEASQGRVGVWVVDNASSDGSPQLVREEFPWVKLLALEQNIGFGPAVNRVAAATQSDWVAPCNADVAARPGALERLLAAGRAHPEAGAIAPRLLLPDGSSQHSVYPFPTLGFTLMFNLGAYHLHPALADRWCLEGGWDPERARAVNWAIGAFLMVRRQAWDSLGGFSEEQWMYAEDLDFGWRLAKAGWSTWYEPAAGIDHESGASAEQAWGSDRTTRWMRSTYAWMLRTRGPLVTRAVGIVNVAGAAARWLAFSLAAVVRPGRWAWKRDSMRAWVKVHASALGSAAALRAHR